MTDVTLFGHWICPYSVRVEFALAQRHLTYDTVVVPPTAVRPPGFVVPQEFLDHSPKREIPMVRVGDAHLADSIPILEWLEAVFPERPLLPSHLAETARTRSRWVDEHVFRPMIGVYYGTDPERIERASDRLAAALVELDRWLLDDAWIAGDEPTIAEAVIVPLYVRLDALRELGFTGDLPAGVRAHAQRMADLDGWAAVEWTDEQTAEVIGRFRAYRRRAAGSVA